jgi:hypothetical protein
MNEANEKKDYFWFYVGALAILLATIVILVKTSESEKFKKIQQLEDEEKSMLNIRVLS